MKKFLSLVLALVMTMSLVTISAGAKDFADDEKITYDEAVAVISEIGVVDGYEDGNFNPQGSLTRGAAAKIICNMILGPTTAAELHADTAPYKDVPTNHTFAGYIAYCAKEGIISGYADGTFRPAGTLTGYAFMKMLLGALGYDASIEGYTGANWSINVAKQALAIGLNKSLEGDFNGVKAVNREEAALYAFNTLKADLVEYDTTITTTINGATVTVGNSQAKAQKWNNSATRINNIENDEYIQFAEQYFNKLVLDPTTDVFGRPAREWTWKGTEIGTYINHDLLVASYTEKVTGKDLYDLLGKSVVEDKDYDFAIYVDGETESKFLGDAYFNETAMNKNNKDKVGETGDGVLTEVYQDSDAKEVTVAIINTYLAKARADYSEKKETASFDVYGIDNKNTTASPVYVKTLTDNATDVEILDASSDDFDVKDVAEDEIYLVTVAEGELQSVEKAESVESATLSAFSKGSYVVADGTKYEYADTVEYDPEVLDEYTSVNSTINLKDLSYNVYLDQYGYMIGVELVEDPDNYVFVTGIDTNGSNLNNVNADVNGIFIDGTVETFKANLTKGNPPDTAGTTADTIINSWCTYTVDKNGVYTLTEVGSAADITNKNKIAQFASKDLGTTTNYEIDKKHVSLPGAAVGNEYANVYGNDDSVYLTAELKRINKQVAIVDVENVTTGVKNANLTAYTQSDVQSLKAEYSAFGTDAATAWSFGVYTLYKNNGYIIATVVVGKDDAASKNLVYVNSDDVELETYDGENDEWIWSRKVIADGVETEIKEKGDTLTYLSDTVMNENEWYQVKYNAEGYVIGIVNETNLNASGALDGGFVININGTPSLATQIAAKDTVLYKERFQDVNEAPYMKGSTLYVDTVTNTGFWVTEDVKAVLIQTNDNKKTTSYEEGVDNLERMLEDLNEDSDGFDYIVSAVIEDGGAEVVIIRDLNKTGNAGDDREPNSDIIVIVNGTEYAVDGGTVRDQAKALKAELEALGYEDVVVEVSGNRISKVEGYDDGIKVTFTPASDFVAAADSAALAAALDSGDTIYLGDGEYTLSKSYLDAVDDLTIVGTGKTTIKTSGIALKGDVSVSGVTFDVEGTGAYALVYNDTSFTGDVVIDIQNCVFNVEDNMGIYIGGTTHKITGSIKGCTFNVDSSAYAAIGVDCNTVNANTAITISGNSFNGIGTAGCDVERFGDTGTHVIVTGANVANK